MTSQDPDVARALGYPYEIPSGSYLLDVRDGVVTAVDDATAVDLARDRGPLLAIGSNGAPEQLIRKFGSFHGSPVIPVLDVGVRDHDVVFAARISPYGAVPATLVPCPGTTAEVKLMLLTGDQVSRMDETESLGSGYEVVDIDVELLEASCAVTDALSTQRHVPCYRASAGPLLHDAAPVALSAVGARGRRWPAMTEAEVLHRLAALEGLDVPAFIRRAATDEAFRQSLNDRLLSGGMSL